MEIQGQYNTAYLTVDNAEETVVSQLYELLNSPSASDMKNIAVMPDCHSGKGCVIGFTAEVQNRICPNLIGVDIGCGVKAVDLTSLGIEISDFESFDQHLRSRVPFGYNVFDDDRENRRNLTREDTESFLSLASKVGQRSGRCIESLGTLGGGNHYIEIDKTEDGRQWLVVHTGSRNLGYMVAEYHQEKAVQKVKEKDEYIPKGLEYLESEDAQEYLDDMRLMNYYAELNRLFILQRLTENSLNSEQSNIITSVHNYYHEPDKIIRKGAIKAYKDEKLLIPLNMRDGIVIGRGKGIPEWNFSAPHGAGRVMSRRQAKRDLNLEQFREQMKGIWTSCISQSTLDEAPDAYKGSEIITEAIGQSVVIDEIAEPVYNFKA